MNLDDYQDRAATTQTAECRRLGYLVPGLAAEVGELMGHLAKFVRGDLDEADMLRLIKKELGDVLWFIARLAAKFGWTLDEVAQANLDKLAARQTAGTIKGNGDDR